MLAVPGWLWVGRRALAGYHQKEVLRRLPIIYLANRLGTPSLALFCPSPIPPQLLDLFLLVSRSPPPHCMCVCVRVCVCVSPCVRPLRASLQCLTLSCQPMWCASSRLSFRSFPLLFSALSSTILCLRLPCPSFSLLRRPR